MFHLHAKPFPALGMTAVVQYDGVPMGYMVDWDDQAIERGLRRRTGAQVAPTTSAGAIATGAGRQRLRWGEVDPIVRSEVLADVAAIVEKAK